MKHWHCHKCLPCPLIPPGHVRRLAPSRWPCCRFIGVVFIAFLVIGLALPVLPLHVHQGLGLAWASVPCTFQMLLNQLA